MGVSRDDHDSSYALGDPPPFKLAVMAANRDWIYPCPFISSRMGVDYDYRSRFDFYRDYPKKAEVIPFEKKGGGRMRFYAIKLPRFLSGMVKVVAKLFSRQR